MSDFNANIIREFRSNGGAVGGPLEGVPLVLLTHRGAKSGALRTTPLRYYREGDRLILFASNLGATSHPAWFHNVVGNPRVTVEVGDGSYEARATVLQGAARDELWRQLVEELPFLIEHQERSGKREIPLVALTRVTDVGSTP
jgi:deazaflavin-dependent oxidoreductase (nitroreductase family)